MGDWRVALLKYCEEVHSNNDAPVAVSLSGWLTTALVSLPANAIIGGRTVTTTVSLPGLGSQGYHKRIRYSWWFVTGMHRVKVFVG